MKILTILGTRPEIIRLSRVIPRLDAVCEQVILHTGQNYDRNLSEVFFEQLGVRRPNHFLEARGSFGQQAGVIFAGCEEYIAREKPDRFLVLGDTNSSLGAIIAKRMGVPVFHMEAGNRCYDDRVPEEVNRRLIDHSSDVLMPYTERSRQNLLREGVEGERIFVTGNPIFEVLEHYEAQMGGSDVLGRLGLAAGKYFLATIHRAENVDEPRRLGSLLKSFDALAERYGLAVVVSTHPRTRARLAEMGAGPKDARVRMLEPFPFFDFIRLEREARCVLSDSGTVQEETAIFGVPSVTLRDTTERPETLECGANTLSGVETADVLRGVEVVLACPGRGGPPAEYMARHVSATVAKIVTGFVRKR